jgi:hypothetical protein
MFLRSQTHKTFKKNTQRSNNKFFCFLGRDFSRKNKNYDINFEKLKKKIPSRIAQNHSANKIK